jgi:hypothetical protein
MCFCPSERSERLKWFVSPRTTPCVLFKNLRQHQGKTMLPPFALVVLPTYLPN